MRGLKAIRKRIATVKSTQKITRAMKMVAGARLNRAQQRILQLRPYAVKTQEVLSEVTARGRAALATAAEGGAAVDDESESHPLLVVRPERRVLLCVLTSDRGLCGSFNTNICKAGEHEWRKRAASGQVVRVLVIGRKGRDYFKRRGAPMEYVPDVWADLEWETARRLGRRILAHFTQPKEPADAIYLVYNEFKSAIAQRVTTEPLLPVPEAPRAGDEELGREFLFEPSEKVLLAQLVPMYLQVSVLRALYESMASELGARMTAMDAATKNAKEMIERLTLQYNRARQAAITKELMEVIGGAEALKG
jgi:F-type H+-transporting ATPase subunit gamma